MPSKSEAILSSHRDAASRVTKHFSAKHNLALKPNDALDVVALVLGAPNWKTLRAMAEQGRAPRMTDLQAVAEASSATPSSLAEALFNASSLDALRAKTKVGYLPPERALAAYDFFVSRESRNGPLPPPAGAHWDEYFEKAQEQLGVQLSNGQWVVANMARRRLSILAGPAGSGRATCLTVLTAALRDAGARVVDARQNNALEVIAREAFAPGEPVDAVLLDERAFERADSTYALLMKLPDDCRIIVVADSDGPGLVSHVSRKMATVPNGCLVRFHQIFRQVAAGRATSLTKLAQALNSRLHQPLPGPRHWSALALKAQSDTGIRFTDGQQFALDHFAHSALSLVAGARSTDAVPTVALFASLMSKAGCAIVDARGPGCAASDEHAAGADVVLLDEHSIVGQADLEFTAQLLSKLKPMCRVVMLFESWNSNSGAAAELLRTLSGLARGRLSPLIYGEGGEVRHRR